MKICSRRTSAGFLSQLSPLTLSLPGKLTATPALHLPGKELHLASQLPDRGKGQTLTPQPLITTTHLYTRKIIWIAILHMAVTHLLLKPWSLVNRDNLYAPSASVGVKSCILSLSSTLAHLTWTKPCWHFSAAWKYIFSWHQQTGICRRLVELWTS